MDLDNLDLTKFQHFHKCQLCEKDLKDPKLCGKCKKLFYCSRECQKLHWKHHKETCKIIEELRNVDGYNDLMELSHLAHSMIVDHCNKYLKKKQVGFLSLTTYNRSYEDKLRQQIVNANNSNLIFVDPTDDVLYHCFIVPITRISENYCGFSKTFLKVAKIKKIHKKFIPIIKMTIENGEVSKLSYFILNKTF